MLDIQSLIKILQSDNPDKRYAACEDLRVSSSLPPEALEALRLTTNDTNPDVADAAKRALALHAEIKIDKVESLQNKATTVNSANSGAYWIMFAILTVIFFGISSATAWDGSCVGILFVVYAVLAISIFSAYNQQNTENEKAVTQSNALREAKEQYDEIRKQVNIPETAKKITYFKSSAKSPIELANSKNKVYIWKSKGNLSFFPCSPSDIYSILIAKLKIYTIRVSQVEYFSKSGEIFRENKISGGGGGGSSIGGAVAGGLIAGDTGAIIGSRKKINQIKSELITHDTRETFLNYFDGNERQTLYFDNNAFQTFNDLIPEKEFSIVSAIKSSEIIKNQVNVNSQSSVTDLLRELAKLRDDGIVTENEFNEKKKQLLDKIS